MVEGIVVVVVVVDLTVVELVDGITGVVTSSLLSPMVEASSALLSLSNSWTKEAVFTTTFLSFSGSELTLKV